MKEPKHGYPFVLSFVVESAREISLGTSERTSIRVDSTFGSTCVRFFFFQIEAPVVVRPFIHPFSASPRVARRTSADIPRPMSSSYSFLFLFLFLSSRLVSLPLGAVSCVTRGKTTFLSLLERRQTLRGRTNGTNASSRRVEQKKKPRYQSVRGDNLLINRRRPTQSDRRPHSPTLERDDPFSASTTTFQCLKSRSPPRLPLSPPDKPPSRLEEERASEPWLRLKSVRHQSFFFIDDVNERPRQRTMCGPWKKRRRRRRPTA